jgi:hypothetical protein
MSRNNPSYLFRSLFSYLGENRFTFLFGSLLLTIGGGELLAEIKMSWGLNILIMLNLLVLLSVIRSRVYFWAGLALFTLSLISLGLSVVSDFRYLSSGSQTSAVALLIMGTTTCFRVALFGRRRVDKERIFASLSLYLMFGLIFALLFALVDKLLPGSFLSPGTPADGLGNRPLSQLVYFSYVTLATLGYGDIIPFSGPAKGLAILEAMIGQLYLVLVVARLVSLYGESESKENL